MKSDSCNIWEVISSIATAIAAIAALITTLQNKYINKKLENER